MAMMMTWEARVRPAILWSDNGDDYDDDNDNDGDDDAVGTDQAAVIWHFDDNDYDDDGKGTHWPSGRCFSWTQ